MNTWEQAVDHWERRAHNEGLRADKAEAALLTARRDALEQAADELNHQPVPKWMQNERASTVDWLRARASTQTPAAAPHKT